MARKRVKRTVAVQTRLTKKEFNDLARRADARGLSVASYVRGLILEDSNGSKT